VVAANRLAALRENNEQWRPKIRQGLPVLGTFHPTVKFRLSRGPPKTLYHLDPQTATSGLDCLLADHIGVMLLLHHSNPSQSLQRWSLTRQRILLWQWMLVLRMFLEGEKSSCHLLIMVGLAKRHLAHVPRFREHPLSFNIGGRVLPYMKLV
jgi:hypothetical protein